MNPRAYWRFLVVVRQFLPLMISYARDRRRYLLFGGSREVSSARRRERATRLLDTLLTLGPTFIKLGQLLSTRPDVLPPEYVEEFQQLQDRVPPAAWPDAAAVIEAELGPVDEAFDSVDTGAVSGASLGQVYRARLDGDPVAVKVRRPGVEALVEADLRVLRWSLPIVLRFVDESRSFSLETLADEFSETIRQEMDYRREARMLREIRGNVGDREDVRIPRVIDSHSTGRVLTMEYVGGTKISDVAELDRLGIDRTALARRLQRLYMQMIIEDGVFHADPHPGNLSVTDDGTLVVYDFGMSGYVDPFVQDRIVDFYGAIARQDIDAILDALIEMGTLSPEADREVMGEVMELAIADARGQDIEQYRVQGIVRQVEDTMYEFPLRLPSNLALVLRVATVVEGVCVTLDPDFDFISVATDFLRERGYVEAGAREYVEGRVDEVREAGRSALRVPPKLEDALDRVERDDIVVGADVRDSEDHLAALAKRLVYGMVVAAGLLSTAILYAFADDNAVVLAAAITALAGFLCYRTFRERGGIQAQPKFTRYQMRQRERRESEAAAGGYGDVPIEEDGTADEGGRVPLDRGGAADAGVEVPVESGSSESDEGDSNSVDTEPESLGDDSASEGSAGR